MRSQETSSGGLSSLVYYLARYPECQARTRAEVLAALGPTADPTIGDLRNHQCLHSRSPTHQYSHLLHRATRIVRGNYTESICHSSQNIPDSQFISDIPQKELVSRSSYFLSKRFVGKGGAIGKIGKDSWIPFIGGAPGQDSAPEILRGMSRGPS